MLDLALGAAIAFCIAAATTPAGVSGAVFLLPVQVSILGVASPSVTPTNLLYNVIATPGALTRLRRSGALRGGLVRAVTTATAAGVIVGAVLRVELLAGATVFLAVIACVLIPLGAYLLMSRPPREEERGEADRPVPARVRALAGGVGVVGGIYGIGGGSLLAPILIAMRFAPRTVVPAALAATFVTSVVGVLTFTALELAGAADGATPDWALGVALGIGGLGGTWVGAGLTERVPEAALRRGLGLLAVALGIAYAARALL